MTKKNFHATPPLPNTAVVPAPPLLALPTRPTVTLALVRTGAPISRFPSISLGTPFDHDCLPDVDTMSLSRRRPFDNRSQAPWAPDTQSPDS